MKAPSPPVPHPHIDRRKAEHEVVNRLAGPIPVVLNERHETRASTSDCLASTLLPWMWAAMCRPDGSYLHDSSIQVPPPHRHDCEELFSIPEGEVVFALCAGTPPQCRPRGRSTSRPTPALSRTTPGPSFKYCVCAPRWPGRVLPCRLGDSPATGDHTSRPVPHRDADLDTLLTSSNLLVGVSRQPEAGRAPTTREAHRGVAGLASQQNDVSVPLMAVRQANDHGEAGWLSGQHLCRGCRAHQRAVKPAQLG